MFELKPLSPEAVDAALEKAIRYRLLNEPMQAESICRDILRVAPGHQKAIVTLLLALTDQFDRRLGEAFGLAQPLIPELADDYSQTYYRGILCERRANAHFRAGGPGSGRLAYEWYRKAMDQYAQAFEIRPAGNDDPILRWNTCARVLNGHRELEPAPEEAFHPLLE